MALLPAISGTRDHATLVFVHPLLRPTSDMSDINTLINRSAIDGSRTGEEATHMTVGPDRSLARLEPAGHGLVIGST